MNKGFFIRILICIIFFGGCLYSYIDMQNAITDLRIQIPKLTKEVRRIEEENTRFLYEIEVFESPENLMRLAQSSAFSHLKYPTEQAVVTLQQADPLLSPQEKSAYIAKMKPTITFAITTK